MATAATIPEAGPQLGQGPYYVPLADEVEVFLAAYEARLPVLLTGPTGCGKTRFVEYMSHLLYRQDTHASSSRFSLAEPLVTVACHEDLSASDLVGRYLLSGEETVWIDGPLTRAVRSGAICYLDEIVEARKDTMVLIHALTDHRRMLPVEKRSLVLNAHDDFLLVMSYNPGYQSVLKDLKPSTRQRFVSLAFDYPPHDREAVIIAHESGVDMETAGTSPPSAPRSGICGSTASRRASALACWCTAGNSSCAVFRRGAPAKWPSAGLSPMTPKCTAPLLKWWQPCFRDCAHLWMPCPWTDPTLLNFSPP